MKKSWVAYPYVVWMIMFIVVPLMLIIFYGTFERTPQGIEFTLEHFKRFFEPLYVMVLIRSLYLALICTIVCLLLGYPVSMILASKEYRDKRILIFLMVIPMWMNFLLRTYAWLTLLEKNGIINTFISFLGLPKMELLYNQWAVVLGMVYNFLPFMVLPIYSVLIKIDKSIIEAAEDLGANSRIVFSKIIFPLSLPGSGFRHYHGIYACCDYFCYFQAPWRGTISPNRQSNRRTLSKIRGMGIWISPLHHYDDSDPV